ncbi:hypothetical protein ACVIWV_006911 [Bradyrhizobium diazoefficiens]|nr:hypothetical protein [Bradyrhizobium diazoefficiens]MBR0861653.1 hypothetical protein [Bradyrhizobium diazoefficiens]MBR0886138.1 hypothetical protein [Bradyrhizobium diazoefficiens]MBR0917961.1 hypothetical protein [Bradyrhizobium diazoefficiens]
MSYRLIWNCSSQHHVGAGLFAPTTKQVQATYRSWRLADRRSIPIKPIGGDKIGLTQQLLAETLGVRRTKGRQNSNTGPHFDARGMITILDHKGLAKRSCEHLETLLDPSAMPPIIDWS